MKKSRRIAFTTEHMKLIGEMIKRQAEQAKESERLMEQLKEESARREETIRAVQKVIADEYGFGASYPFASAFIKKTDIDSAKSPVPPCPERVIAKPIPMILHCPMCSARHIDKGTFAVEAHKTHACQECGHLWQPCLVPTVGVQFLPGCKNE